MTSNNSYSAIENHNYVKYGCINNSDNVTLNEAVSIALKAICNNDIYFLFYCTLDKEAIRNHAPSRS